MIQGRTVANDSATGVFLDGSEDYRPICDGNVRRLTMIAYNKLYVALGSIKHDIITIDCMLLLTLILPKRLPSTFCG